MFMSRKRINQIGLCSIAVLTVCMTIGCEKPPGPFVPKSCLAPPIGYCNDHTGHQAGSKPFVMDGTCCCTPTPKLMAKLHADGFCKGMDAEDLKAAYRKAGIALKGPGHTYCNGLCDHGPHVVLGGKCMSPPRPGTAYYDKVVCPNSYKHPTAQPEAVVGR